MKNKNSLILLCAIFCAQFMVAQDYYWPLKTDLNEQKAGLNGTNHGVTFGTDPVRGGVAEFDGNSYANLPQFIKGNTALSVTLWWRMDEVRPWSRLYSFGHGDLSEPKDVMMVIPVNGAGDPVKNFYRFTLSDPTGPWLDADIDPALLNINLGEWNYSAVVIKDDSIIFYHNDLQVFAEGGFTRKIETLDDTQNAIGKSFWPDALFKGALSDLRVYKSGLSKAEVIAQYNATINGGTGIMNPKTANQPLVTSANNRIGVVLQQQDANALINVYGIAGNLICSKSIAEISNVNISNGIYLVTVITNNNRYTQKLVVK